ncbi:MAG: HD domain-containing protein [Lachnospiraceae bacterium]|nr:HD domain-containing protein [Lachnospiraceae bacterium]
MLFVKNDDLKVGMRLAKPIYNKKGVLLYDRNSKLTQQGIDSVQNFGLIGLFILEPAEPIPPMSEEDMEFERFQTVAVFQIMDELEYMVYMKKPSKMSVIVADIIKHYGRLNKKINFVQNLRSKDDHVYKHSLNVGMLCAMMTHVLNLRLEEQNEIVTAGVVHDIGKLTAPKKLKEKGMALSREERIEMDRYEKAGAAIVENAFNSHPNIKRTMVHTNKLLEEFRKGVLPAGGTGKIIMGARVLMVAETFDTMTAMNDYREPSSEIGALKFLMANPGIFDPKVVAALVKSINFLTNGCTIELSNGEKGLVIAANDDDVLKPMVLQFSDNSIIDLARNGKGIEITDVMKTMDNRCVIDKEALKGVNV